MCFKRAHSLLKKKKNAWSSSPTTDAKTPKGPVQKRRFLGELSHKKNGVENGPFAGEPLVRSRRTLGAMRSRSTLSSFRVARSRKKEAAW